MQKPQTTVYYDKKGPSGNIFYILSNVKDALRKERRILDYNECWQQVQLSHSYEDALNIIRNYVILIERED